MITEDQAVVLLRAANPVPKPESTVSDVDVVDVVAHLKDAEQRTEEMITTEPKPTGAKRRGWTTGLAAAVAVLILGVAMVVFTMIDNPFATPTTVEIADAPEPTPNEDLVGFWVSPDECCGVTSFLHLAPDGTFHIWVEWLGFNPNAVGTYEVDDTTITFTDHNSESSNSWIWDVSINQETGELHVYVPEEYDGRGRLVEEPHLVAAGTEFSYVRVPPTTSLTSGEAGWRVPAATDVSGYWLLESPRAGVLLVLKANTYELGFDGWMTYPDVDLGGVPVDRGTFEILDDGILRLTSTGEGSCAPGDSWVWTDLQFSPGNPQSSGPPSLNGLPSALAGTVIENDCGLDLGSDLLWRRAFVRP